VTSTTNAAGRAPGTAAGATGGRTAGPDPRRWWALAVIAVAQLMVVLDATIVNIALPQAQHALAISDADRQWVVTAYSLTFGGLLLLGGRIADYWGRKRAFVAGIVGFALASALGGLAQNSEMLFAARALQGACGALLAPASLALLTVMFTEARERAKAFGVYGAIAGGGAAVGLLLGGVLTEYTSWRWCLLVNIPVAVVAVVAALPLVRESRAHGNTRYDVPGAILVTAGLVSLVYGFTKASTDGWGAAVTWGFIGGAVLLLALFVLVEVRSANPLLPMRIIAHSTRGGAYLASLLTGVGFIGAMLFLTYYLQGVLGFSPIRAGLGSLPLTGGVLITAGVASALVPKVGAKSLMAVGSALAALGMLWLAQIGVQTSYWTHVLPPLFVMGIGLGLVFVPLGNVGLVGVGEHDAGAASAVINASQQVGGSLGTALLNTIATTATTAYAVSHPIAGLDPTAARLTGLRGLVHGFVIAFGWGAALLGAAAVIVLVLIRAGREDTPTGAPTHLG
jgi:EmrB/QacA subfamily drug resistance transporter